MAAHAQPIAYRPDIDGLRAFAVLSVVIYHAFPETLKGGFIGVDVFFVISGYLIGGIILRDLERGEFSFWNFYSRRIRRIFPALIVVLASTLAFGWFALLPDEYKSLGKHVLGGSTFISNIILWQEAGYFDVEAKAKPLLHLWSLGIEEQFYILFPLVLYFCFRKKIRIFYCIVILLFLSFVYNIYLHNIDRTADFYSPATRIWELLVGVLCFLFKNKSNVLHPPPTNLLISLLNIITAIIGTFCMVAALRWNNENTPYPGWNALLPVIGASCLIIVRPNLISNYILSNRFSVFIGKISYPFYLWHWVIISYAYIIYGGFEDNTTNLRLFMILFSLILSILTYLFIEKPIRFSSHYKISKIIIVILLMVSSGFCGYKVYKEDGYTFRYNIPNYIIDINSEVKESSKRCSNVFPEWIKLNDNSCKFSNNYNNAKLALIGDSHAGHLFPGLAYKYDSGIIDFQASCAAPYIDISSGTKGNAPDWRKHCSYLINKGFEYIIEHKNINTVILAHAVHCSYNNIIDNRDKYLKNQDIILENGVRRTLELLKDRSVIIILDNPKLPFNPEKCIIRNLPIIKPNKACKFDKKIHDNSKMHNWYNNIISRIAKDYPNVTLFNMTELFCDDEVCYLQKNGKLLYQDRTHLTIDGSLYVADYLLEIIGK